MSVAWWLCAAGLVLLLLPGSAAGRRVDELARAGRLASARGSSPLGGVERWNRLGGLSTGRAVVPGSAVTAGCLAWAVAGPALAVAAAALSATAVALGRRALHSRAAACASDELARALRLMMAELGAGSSPAGALSAAAGLGGAGAAALADATRAAGRGDDPAASLIVAGGPLAAVGHALRVADRTGAPLAGVLGRVVADVAAEREQRRAAAVALAGPRSSAALLAGLPLLGVLLGAAMGARPLHFLFAVPAGRGVCAFGVLLDVAGVWWVAAVLRRAERA